MTTIPRLLAASALVLALAAPAAAQTTVTMWTFLDVNQDGGREVALRQMIEDFEAANPDIRIQVEPQVWTTMAERFVLGANAGNAPDIAWVNSENLGFIMNSDVAADLSSLVVGQWTDEQRDDFLLNASFSAVTTDDEAVLAIPIMASTWVLMYRRDLLEQAGLTVEDISTWEGVTEAARTIVAGTTDAGRPVWGIGLGLSQERFSVTPAFLASIDGQEALFDESCMVQLATEAGMNAVDMQVRWITEDLVTPREALAMSSDDAIDQFAAGNAAMMIIANSRFEQIQRTAAGWDPDDLAIAPVPGVSADNAGPALISGWWAVVWNGSPRSEEAARFVAHMTGQQGAALWNVPGEQVPTYRSLFDSADMQVPERAHLAQVGELLQQDGVLLPGRCNWGRTQADLNLATQQVVLGQADLESALRQAEQATNDRQ